MRILVCGLGSIGRRHLSNILSLSKHKVAVCDINGAQIPTWFKNEHDVFTDIGAAFKAFKPDALVIATPAQTHTSLMRIALEHRAPFLVEKPLATYSTMDEAKAIASECDRAGLQCMVGYNLRFQPQARALRLGARYPSYFKFGLMCDMAVWPGSASEGDPVAECSHEIDLALWFGGRPARAVDFFQSQTAADIAFDKGSVQLNWAWRGGYLRRWEAVSEHFVGTASFDAPSTLGASMYIDEIAEFINSVDSRVASTDGCTLEQGLRVMEVCHNVSNRLNHKEMV